MTPTLPPLDCSLNLREILDFHIDNSNLSPAYAFPHPNGHIVHISHFEFARAAHRAAHLIRPQRRGSDGEIVVLLALTDVLVYQTLIAGCIVAGLVPFPISSRNSEAVILHLLGTTGCHRVLTTRGSLARIVDGVQTAASRMGPAHALSVEDIPVLVQLYPGLGEETPADDFLPYLKPSTPTPLDEPALYLHSSGSTGFPKSIAETHRQHVQWAALGFLQQIFERSPRHAVGNLPAFHMTGLMGQFLLPMLVGGTACIYPPASLSNPGLYMIPGTPTAQNALENARRGEATGIATVPSFVLEWVQDAESLEYLKSLKLLICTGGPLPSLIGDELITAGVKLTSMYGATELNLDRTAAETKEWSWTKFSKRANVRWAAQGDGTFECQFLVCDTHPLAVENLPDVRGYSTKDLFEIHPTLPNLYRIVGRLDDVIVLANGEKVVPGPMEDIINASPLIAGAVMFGRERNHVGLLVEPSASYDRQVKLKAPLDVEAFRTAVWKVVEDANKTAPGFARIFKEMIVVTGPERPMVRAAKGTVVKKATISLYEGDINDLYRTIEGNDAAILDSESDIVGPISWTAAHLEEWLLIQAQIISNNDNITPRTDLFDHGLDSLNETFLRHWILVVLRARDSKTAALAAMNLPLNFVYSYPEVGSMARALERLVNDAGMGNSASQDVPAKVAVLEAMISKHSSPLPVGKSFPAPDLSAEQGKAVVLLTGSTGSLGSHLLEMLLKSPEVEIVYAFNRTGTVPVARRQRGTFDQHGLDTALLDSPKLVYLEGDTSKKNLGLTEAAESAILEKLTVIIHNAWTLDFNKNLTTFEPHVRGMHNLIDLAHDCQSRPRFLFTSSVSSAQGWNQENGINIPEEIQLDARTAVGTGYGESKYVAERLLAMSGLPATSFRIGQVCGAQSTGAWATSDWIPALAKSSLELGAFPSLPNSEVAWIRPEAVWRTIVEVALTRREEMIPQMLNLVHPKPVQWDEIMSHFAMPGDSNQDAIPLIPMSELGLCKLVDPNLHL
ncbi:acetyl-CoA synthetase-like protein [Mycena amicta]|nr:acetyl-CoA synthetase-like protein [Mycena amicta]